MNLRHTLLAFTLLFLAAGRLLAAEVWFTSAPSPVESGQGYYVEAYTYSYYENGINISLYKNGGWFASGGGWADATAGAWTSDAGPQTVNFMAETYDPYDGSSWAWASVAVNGTPPPANNPPSAWVEVDGYGPTATVTRPYGGTVNITVRYKAGDADGNLARIRPQVWHPGTGLFTNDGGAWTGQGGGYGEVVRTITLDRNGDWYFWTDAEDTNNVFVNSGAWGDAFRLSVVEGAPPDTTPPGSPQNLAVSGLTSSAFTLSWSAPSGEAATGYQVRLNGGAATAVSGLSHTFTSLADNTSYAAQVSARDAAGNWSGWVGVGATTGGSGGGTASAESVWLDVTGDGILDEIVRSDTAQFSYFIDTWYTTNFVYVAYPVQSFWTGFGVSFFNRFLLDFSRVWLPADIFWVGYTTHFDLVFSVEAEANRPFRIYRDLTGSSVLNPANWQLILSTVFSSSGTQSITHGIANPDDLAGTQYFLVKEGLPVGSLQLSDTSGNVLVNNVTAGGTIDYFLPANGQLTLKAKDIIGNLIVTGTDISWRLLDEVGNVIQDWVFGNSITIGSIAGDSFGIQIRRGTVIAALFTARPIKPTLEPITTSGGVPPRNPSGFEIGTQATFEVSLNLFTGVADNDIVWTSSGGISFLNGNNRGKSVTVTGTAAGPASLEVQVGNFAGLRPTVTTNVYTKNTVPLFVYVVRNSSGGSPAATQAQITTMINRANLIYKQAAIEFVQQGGINYIDNSAWLTIHDTNDFADGKALTSSHSGTGGLEVYFVDDLQPSLGGLHIASTGATAGLIMNSNLALMNTLAHELGHACGLQDIYIGKGATQFPNDKVKKLWLPLDWNNGPDAGPAYYDKGLTQRTIISDRLLMYGTNGANPAAAVVMPRGQVKGIRSTGPDTGVEDFLNVGLAGMTRNPVHP